MGTSTLDEADEGRFADLPDPGLARDPGQLVAQLNRLRAWAGQPSLRVLRSLAGAPAAMPGHRPQSLPVSTTQEVLAGKRLPRLPRLEFVEAYVAACLRARSWPEREIATEIERWRRVWRTLALPSDLRAEQDEAPPPEHPAPVGPAPVGPAGVGPAPVDRASAGPVARAARRPRRRRALLTVLVFLLGMASGVAAERFGGAASADRSAAGASASDAGLRVDSVGGPCVTPARPDGTELIGDRGFTTGTTGHWWDLSAANLDVDSDDGRLRIRVLGGTAEPWDAILMRRGLALTEGRRYTLAFDIRTTVAVRLRVTVQENRPPEYNAVLMRDFHTDSVPCHRKYSFVAERGIPRAEVTFQFGGHAEDFEVELANLSLVEEAESADPD